MGNCQNCNCSGEQEIILPLENSQQHILSTQEYHIQPNLFNFKVLFLCQLQKQKLGKKNRIISMITSVQHKQNLKLFRLSYNFYQKLKQVNEEGQLVTKLNELFWRNDINYQLQPLFSEEKRLLCFQFLEKHKEYITLINQRYMENIDTVERQKQMTNSLIIEEDQLDRKYSNKQTIQMQQFGREQGMQTLVGNQISLIKEQRNRSQAVIRRLNKARKSQINSKRNQSKQQQFNGFQYSVHLSHFYYLRLDSQSNYSQPDSSQCKICLSQLNTPQNPLLNPCKCNGTMRYIHLICLVNWLKLKSNSNSDSNCTVLLWNQLECELCKFRYQPQIACDGNLYDIVQLSKPANRPYLLLDFYQKIPQNQSANLTQSQSSGIYIIYLDNKQTFNIGRSHDTDININDISVSRIHANLKLIGEDLYLTDKRSKFGTLVLLKNNLTITGQLDKIEIQIGKNLIQFQFPQSEQKMELNEKLHLLENHLGRINQNNALI